MRMIIMKEFIDQALLFVFTTVVFLSAIVACTCLILLL